MKETGKVIRWVVVGLMCAGGTTLIWRASMSKGTLSRQHLPEQPLESVNDGLRHSAVSQLQEANPAALGKSSLSSRARVNETYSKLSLSFEANSGQTDPRVKFLSRGRGYTLFLTSDEAVLTLRNAAPGAGHPRAFGNSKLAMLRSKFAGRSRGRATDAGPWGTHRLPPLLEAPKSRVADIGSQAPGAQELAPAAFG